MSTRPVLPWLAALATAGLVASCGNAERLRDLATAATPRPAAVPDRLSAGASEQQRQQRAAPGRASLLASPFGPAPRPQGEPGDPDARTRAGQYITRWQAQELDGLLGDAVVWVAVACCDASELDLAEGLVHGDMAARDLPPDTTVVVDGDDARQAARLADRLSDAGLTRVLLISR